MRERNGAPRHPDDKLDRLIRTAVAGAMQEQNGQIVTELREVVKEQQGWSGASTPGWDVSWMWSRGSIPASATQPSPV